jgi:UDP-N-acetylglucosamine/UDP-N-acetylgalactosamine 4-epimerase
MPAFAELQSRLKESPRTWLVTGAAGFIGSNLVETLLKLDQRVAGLDNFATGKKRNLEQLKDLVAPAQWSRFQFLEGSICDLPFCQEACSGVDYVLHQAALGSVPRSMLDPLGSHESNVTGFMNMLLAARDGKARRFVYASSSAIYGDHPALPKIEDQIGEPLSPYAATKLMNEIYAGVFSRAYDFDSIGLRYFNVFGPRQDPEGAYAAVIPKWIDALLRNEPVQINGDGETSRDFCYIDNVVQANLLAATTENPEAAHQACNIAVGEATTLNELFHCIQESLRRLDPALPEQQPVYREFRPGDVRHSLADISKARRLLGYEPTHKLREGLETALAWYRANR